jgi:hypothetical protein
VEHVVDADEDDDDDYDYYYYLDVGDFVYYNEFDFNLCVDLLFLVS